MPLTLEALNNKRAELDLEVDGDLLHVVYLPFKLTFVVRKRLRQGVLAYIPVPAPEDAEERIMLAYRAYCDDLATVLVEWDMLRGKEPYPITGESLTTLAPDFVLSVAREVAKDSLANPLIVATSKSTSQAGEGSEPSPNGTA